MKTVGKTVGGKTVGRKTVFVGLHVPDRLHVALKRRAAEQVRPMSKECIAALYERVGMAPDGAV